jgi:hypothetical protein
MKRIEVVNLISTQVQVDQDQFNLYKSNSSKKVHHGLVVVVVLKVNIDHFLVKGLDSEEPDEYMIPHTVTHIHCIKLK